MRSTTTGSGGKPGRDAAAGAGRITSPRTGRTRTSGIRSPVSSATTPTPSSSIATRITNTSASSAAILCSLPKGTIPTRHPLFFNKKVRYLCGLFGHRVHHVTDRNGFSEYACHCGHTFLKAQGHMSHITHPLICVASGHRIRYVESRGGWAEYVCRDCGHPFCFAATPPLLGWREARPYVTAPRATCGGRQTPADPQQGNWEGRRRRRPARSPLQPADRLTPGPE